MSERLDKLSEWLSAVFHKYGCVCCWLAKLMARRERGAYPLRYVTSEQRSQRLCEPQPDGAWRKGASASLPLLNDALGHRLRRAASHLPLSAHAKRNRIYETQHLDSVEVVKFAKGVAEVSVVTRIKRCCINVAAGIETVDQFSQQGR